jgi:hypothetical protein
VRLVIADTGPINYLVLIGSIDLLPALFERVILPSAVQAELADPDAQHSVREWIAAPLVWLHIHETPDTQFRPSCVSGLDEGEAAAIALALSLGQRALVLLAFLAGLVGRQRLAILEDAAGVRRAQHHGHPKGGGADAGAISLGVVVVRVGLPIGVIGPDRAGNDRLHIGELVGRMAG